MRAEAQSAAVERLLPVLTEEELAGAKKVLTAAALTYLAALAGSVLQLIRLMLIAGSRTNSNRRD